MQELRNGVIVRTFLCGGLLMPVAELDAAGVVKTEYVYGSGSVAPDYLLQGGKTIYLLRDQLGSVQMAIDASTGAVLQELEYDATGVVTRNTSPAPQPFSYAGGLVDVDGRFVHFGARDYDPRTGRWLKADPIGAGGGANRDTYGASDPVNRIDPSGQLPNWPSIRRDLTIRLVRILINLSGERVELPVPPDPQPPVVNPDHHHRAMGVMAIRTIKTHLGRRYVMPAADFSTGATGVGLQNCPSLVSICHRGGAHRPSFRR